MRAELPSAHYRTSQMDREAADRLRRVTLAAETSLGGATQRVRRIRVTEPFNGVVAVARNSYLHYVRRWSGYLMRIADDPVPGIDEPLPAFSVSRAAAAAAFRAATPPLAGTELRQRAAALFTHEPRRNRRGGDERGPAQTGQAASTSRQNTTRQWFGWRRRRRRYLES